MSTDQDPPTPIPPQDHDVVVFPKKSVTQETGTECFRVPVVKTGDLSPGAVAGTYVETPKSCTLQSEGIRKAISFMHPERFDPPGTSNPAQMRGPAFAVAPVKADPAPVNFCTCFLINAEYFTEPNLWTIEEWNDDPGGPDYGSRPHPDQVKALLALPWGQVLKLTVERPREEAGTSGARGAAIAPKPTALRPPVVTTDFVDLAKEPEIWQQLRNGCVAGRALLGAGPTAEVLPLVNLTALMPLPPAEGKRNP